MQVHYVTPIVFGLVVAVWLLVLVVLAVRAAQAGHSPRLSPGWATTITVVVAMVGFSLILRPDGRSDDVRVTEFLIMLGSFFVRFFASLAPAILIVRWLAPPSMLDEEQKRKLEIEHEHMREQMEKRQESSAQRMVVWHVPILTVGVIVIAAFCVIVLARGLMR